MSNNKTKIISKPKPSIANKAWTYVGIAGALVAMIYAGLSQQNHGVLRSQTPETRIESSSQATDSAAHEVDSPTLYNQQDPSH